MRRMENLTLTFSAELVSTGEGQPTGKRFRGVAYSGGLIPGYWGGRDAVIDLAGLKNPSAKVPVLADHNASIHDVAGHGALSLDNNQLLIAGDLTDATDTGRAVAALLASQVPLQMSVGIQAGVEEYSTPTEVSVNGRLQKVSIIFRNPTVREVSFVPLGADPRTSVAAFAAKRIEEQQAMADDATLEQLRKDLAAQKARADEAEKVNATLQKQVDDIRLAARKAEVQALFKALGREFGDEAAKPYLEMTDATFAAVRKDLEAAKPKLPEHLFREQATSGQGDQPLAKFAAPQGYTVDPERADLHMRALAWQANHPNTDYLAAIRAVSQ